MNILTKICIVVQFVLVMFACVVFISGKTVPENWRYRYQQKDQENKLNAQAVRFGKLALDRATEDVKTVKAQADGLAKKLAEAEQNRVPDPTETMIADLKSQLQAATTRLAELQLNVEAMSKRNERLSGQLDDSRKAIAALQDTNRRGTAEITMLRGKLERSERVVAALQRQLMDRDERIAELERIAGEAKGTSEKPEQAVVPGKLVGTITNVRGELASINIGSAHGVVRGVKLYIYRNANFVGYLRVDEVDQGESAGTIVDKQLDPAAGDKVTNDLLK